PHPERMTGEDGIFLRFERPDTPTHTLKMVVLDPARRGAQITLDDLHRIVPEYLALTPRATQRVGRMPGKRAWAWVTDEDFDLAHHLDEVVLDAPDRAALDQVCSELAMRQLDRRHPLWAMTLVHGLDGGLQAVVVRVHHAINDGKSTINLLHAATSEAGAAPAPVMALPATPVPHLTARTRAAELVRAVRHSSRASREFGPKHAIPGLVRRMALNPRGGGERVCASGSLDLHDLKAVAKGSGVTVNGVFHAVVAGAMRDELLSRGERVDRPQVAAFGIAEATDPDRRHGNAFATSFAYLHVELADPLERLNATSHSAAEAIRLRWAASFDYYRKASDITQHFIPRARAIFANITPIVGNQITTANVPGPKTVRWFGDVELVEWTSYSIALAPSMLSLTGYSYRDRMFLGLTAIPEAMPDPAGFVARLERSLAELLERVGTATPV
ncbi:MAG: putative diacylglycerol O-acyltransferase, partial [Marmoricola sp.]|nr:putative diacylglycerol O-acyltransferase [Marmoricola sp.]